MPNNIVVDTSAINNAIKRVDSLWAEAAAHKYWISPPGGAAFWSNAFHVNQHQRDLKIEAVAIPFNRGRGWDGVETSTISINYNLKLDFSMNPIVSVTYDGDVNGVTATVDVAANKNNATDIVKISLTKPGNQKWHRTSSGTKWNADTFYVHLIAIGT